MNLKLKHKKLYALLVVLCLVLSIVTLFTACGDTDEDVNGGEGQGNTPSYTEGPECGVYYYDVVDGEVILTLSGGNTFTLTGPDYNKSGNYTADGSKFVLDFAKDEDNTATATIADNKLTLVWGDTTMTLLRRVSHTISFDTKGGSEVAAQTVVNGKTANRPADPTMEGHRFLGWYSDSACTSLFNFDINPITSSVTVYARGAEIGTTPAYTVSFDLGYAGAPELDSIETINGVAYGITTPKRDGYTFSGWWISMYDDASKLTYAYKDGKTTFDSDTTLYAAWTPTNVSLAAPMASVTDKSISWTPVSGAISYKIEIKDDDGIVIHRATETGASHTFNFDLEAAGDYVIEVTSVGAGNTQSEVTKRCFINKALAKPSCITVVNEIFVWNPVAGADYYLVTVDCGNKEHNHTNFNNNKSTYFDFSNCSMQKGGIKFTVTAVGSGYASSVSKTFVYEKNLDAVGNLEYDAANDAFVWSPVANALSYTVVVTVGQNTYTFDNGMNTSFSLAAYTGDITVSVTPVSVGFNSPEAATAMAQKTAPVAPSNLQLNGTELTWSSDATKFSVTVAGKTFTVEGKNKFDIASKHSELKLNTLANFVVSVVAIADGSVSSPATLEVNLKEMSPKLYYSDKVLYWPAVYEGTTFQIRVNGGTEFTVEGQNFAPITLTQAGENVIEVICANFGTDWNTSVKIVVYAYEVKYMSRSEAGETVEYLAIGDTLTPPTGITVDGYTFGGWYNTPSAAQGNGKEYTSAKFFGNGDTVLYANWTPNDYKIIFEVDETFVSDIKDGDTADVTYTKHFTLPVPTSTDISRGYFVGWYTGPDGTGDRLTDEFGNSVIKYPIKDNTHAYAFFAQALKYTEIKDGDAVVGYAVSKGLAINNKSITSIQIPAFYNGKPVLEIVEKAFHSCYNIVSITLPDTILRIGPGAFDLCNRLQSIEIVDSDPNKDSDSPYSTHDGVLQYKDKTSGKTYLEFFPVAKYGSYTVSNDVQIIRPNAFKNSKISEIVISTSVETINANAFADCYRLTKIEFAFGNTKSNTVTIEDGAFNNVPNVETLILPAHLNTLPNIKVFDAFESLSYIEVEPSGMFYSAKNNLLCDSYGKALLYVPRSFRGVFEVPAGITDIGPELMKNNPYVTEVIIGEHIKSIASSAFLGCTSLTKVVILGPRDEQLEIGDSAFSSCTALLTLEFVGGPGGDADTVTGQPIRIGQHAFFGCSALVSIDIGENVNIYEIGTQAFAGNISLEQINAHSKITIKVIREGAFANCSSLRAFEIHKTTTSIGDGAFENCAYLTTVSLGNGIGDLALGKDVFKNCKRLTTISLPSTLTAFDSSLFDGCDNIQNIIVDDTNPYLQSLDGVLYTKGLTELIYYPKTKPIVNGVLELNNPNLQKIGPSVFKDNQQIRTVKIGATVVEISKNAFENCKNLSSIVFEGANSSFTLGDYAFAGCTSLTGINLPASTTRIGHYAFNNSALATFTIPDATTHIGYYAFALTNLKSITITKNVVWIGQGAFFNVRSLTEVLFDARTADLQLGHLDLANLDKDGIKVDSTAGIFKGTGITSISLPKQVTYIGMHAFDGLSSLTSATIPADSTLATLEEYAFNGTGITEIVLPEGLLTIGKYALANTALKSVHIPSTVTWIYEYALSSTGITSITFEEGSPDGEGLHINNGAFVGTAITAIHLPAQLKQIGQKDDDFGFDAVIRVFYGVVMSGDKCNFKDQDTLTKITVSAQNTVYTAIDGVLYRLGIVNGVNVPRTLLYSPSRNLGADGVITVPATVSIVQNTAFLKTRLTKIIFEEYDEAKHGDFTPGVQLSVFDGQNYSCPPVISNAVDVKDGITTTISSLKLLQLPKHLTAVLSYTINGYAMAQKGSPELVVRFNPESYVRFAQNAMRSNSAIVTLELPNVTGIGQFAFDNNSNIKTLTFADSSTVDTIGQRAFENLSSLSSFTLPASVKFIEYMAFKSLGSSVKDQKVEFKFEKGSVLETIADSAFDSAAITSFVMPNSVTALGSKVFNNAKIETLTISANLIIDVSAGGSFVQGCTTLKEIIVPEDHATLSSFEGVLYDKHQTSLYVYPAAKADLSYSIPDTVIYIAPGTFYKYKGTYLKLPKNLTAIDAEAFRGSKLETIEIPASVTVIGDQAFSECSNLKTIIIPKNSNLTTIGYRVFYGVAITEIYLPDTVAEIGAQTFESCRNLKSITLPTGLKALNNSTFKSCSALESIVLNDGLETIGNDAFKYCHALTSIDIPNSVTSIGQYAFHDCKALVEFICDDEASALRSVGFSCFLNCVSLEKVVFGPGVSVFGWNNNNQYDTFKGCTNLKEVVLPADLIEIPAGMFKNLASLEKVTLPANLGQLGNEAFMGCPKLTTITIPASVKSLGTAAFAKTGLKEVIFAPGSMLTAIPANLFAECTNLTKIHLPASISKIDDGAFALTALTEIELPEELVTIGNQAFYGCSALTAIYIPGSVNTIGDQAFEGCSEITSLVLCNGIKNIGNFAFADCIKIAAVSIPQSVTKIGDNPFTGCIGIKTFALDSANVNFNYIDGVLYDSIGYSLIYYSTTNDATRFVIPESVFEIKGGAFSGSKLVEIVLGSNIKAIPSRAFSGCEALENIVITNTITTIGDAAFMGCTALKTLSIPQSVTFIGEAAFANCKNLSTFIIEERKTDLKVSAYLFYGCEKITRTYDFPGNTQYYPYMYAGTGITSVVMPEYITDVNVEGVFANSAIESVTFPSQLKNFSTLGKNFFAGSKLKSVSIPANITTIGEGAFKDCTELTSFTAVKISSLGASALEGCTSLTSLTINNGYTAMDAGISIGNRALANCSSLTAAGTNIFTYAYSYGTEALLNCSALTGEITLSAQLNQIANYAFSGCNGITKLSIGGKDFHLEKYAFAGLTGSTTIYFSSALSLDALIDRIGSDTGWSENTEANLTYYTPSTGDVTVTLTDEELKKLQEYVDKGLIDAGMVDGIKDAWLAYKASFTTLYPEETLTKDEIKALDEFISTNKIKIDSNELQKAWIEYKKTLAKELTNHPKYFTADELASSTDIMAKMDETTKAKFMQAWFDYKLSYSDANPSAEISKEENEALKLFCSELGIDGMMDMLLKLWPEYKKTLAAGLVTPNYIDLTQEELDALMKFCEKNGIKGGFEDIKTAWMLYKGSLEITSKDDAKELTAEEILLVKNFISTYGLKAELEQEYCDKLLAYKSGYAQYFLQNIPLTEEEKQMIETFISGANLDKSTFESLAEDLYNYKKNFFLSGFQPDKELTEAETNSYNDFMNKYGVDAKVADKLIDEFKAYRMKLAGK